MESLREYRLRILALGLLALGLSGCAEGPFSNLGAYNPWVRSRWAENDKKYGPSMPTQLARLESIRDSSGSMSPADQQRYSQELAALAQSEKNILLRVEAVRTLGAFRTPQAADALRIAQADEDPEVRIAACEAWRQHGGAEAIEALATVLGSDTDAEVRHAATRNLGAFRDPAAVRALGIALDDRDHPELQYRAVQSLKSVSGKDYGDNLSAWREYVRGGDPAPQQEPRLAERLRGLF